MRKKSSGMEIQCHGNHLHLWLIWINATDMPQLPPQRCPEGGRASSASGMAEVGPRAPTAHRRLFLFPNHNPLERGFLQLPTDGFPLHHHLMAGAGTPLSACKNPAGKQKINCNHNRLGVKVTGLSSSSE